MVRRNKLIGQWAAQKLGLVGESARTYSNDLARGTFDIERNDVLAIILRDFDAAGVVQSKDQIRSVMTQSWLNAGSKTDGADASDAALVQIARKLM
ncbi:ATPase inhibitor subunit zeta [Sinorhizobium sp. A49]|uniref:ATPase inhibitor subunit zeta n=1 Tax=Sinorhizobium sp. A49 TaxID=1945861 RepID=UPI000985FD2F|nr:ATPase inhibitor subunit zeta [Sinorhizobium sp. A49]